MKHEAPQEPYEDPLIDEVRQRRRDLAAQCDNDLDKLFELIRRIQDEHPEKVVKRQARTARS